MKMTSIRGFRHVTALLALFCVLFMQFAVAAYACPGGKIAQKAVAINMDTQAMPNCHDMDPEQPALCHAYGQSGNQSLDKPATPQIPPFVPSQFVAFIEVSLDAGK